MDVAQVFAALDIHDHSRIERWRIGIVPEKEFLTVALEGDFYEVSQALFRPRAEAEEFLPAPSHQLFGAHLPQLLEVPIDDVLEC